MKKINYLDSINSPIITEKATTLSDQNKVVFKVHKNASKNSIKKNIEKIFKVKVVKINTIKKPLNFELAKKIVRKYSKFDFIVATNFFAQTNNLNKLGIGFDVHKLETKRKLYLGGIKIPYHLGLKGHSDGDVIIHAIIDALLGACRLKDIGTIFSNKNKKYKNIRSPKMLNKVLRLINQKGYSINNIDINVIAEKPKISKYRNKIINSISKLCNIDKNKINIKGKTTEKLGLIGKEKAIAAEVITSIYKYD